MRYSPSVLGGMAMAAILVGCGSPPEPSQQGGATGGGTNAAGSGTSTSGSSTSGAGGSGNAPACDPPPQGEGHAMGQIAENWSLPDHLGQMIELFGFCGKVIFFEEGSMW